MKKMFKQAWCVPLAMALATGPVVAQSNPNEQPTPSLTETVLATLHPRSNTAVTNSQVRASIDAVAPAAARRTNFIFATADFPGAEASVAFDANLQVILGAKTLGNTSGFTLRGITYDVLTLPGASESAPVAINANGEIVGVYVDATNALHGFLDVGGTLTNIDNLVARPGTTTPQDISDGGEIVGGFTDTNNALHGFFTNDRGATFGTIDYPGATSTEAAAVNTAGIIVGSWIDAAGTTHGFVLQNGVFTAFDFPLAKSTNATGINDADEIAGSFFDANNVEHGFLLTSTGFSQVDVPGAVNTDILRIKNNGRIVGAYSDQLGETHGLFGH